MSESDPNEPDRTLPESSGNFPGTRQTLIRNALSDDERIAEEALNRFALNYWPPMYAFLRRAGEPSEEAKELVQGFFTERIMKKRLLGNWDPDRGKLRSFLLMNLKSYRIDTKRKNDRREGKFLHFSIEDEEMRYLNLPDQGSSAEDVFDREWCRSMMREVFKLVGEDYEADGREEEFHVLYKSLRGQHMDETQLGFQTIARMLDTSVSNVKHKMRKFKQRFREHLERIVEETVPRGDAKAEIANLLNLASR